MLIKVGRVSLIGIYKITNEINGKAYVGQSVNIKKRWREHKYAASHSNDKCYNYPLYCAMREYGTENFKFEVLEECDVANLNAREIFYIAKYKTYGPNGYNQDEGGKQGATHVALSNQHIQQIIDRLKTSMDSISIIAKDFNVCPITISLINRGLTYHRENEKYPIRPKLSKLMPSDTLPYELKQNKWYCSMCGDEITKGNNLCFSCYNMTRRKAERPEPIDLAKMVKESSFTAVANKFGVSSKAIQKWCQDYKIPHTRKGLVDWYNEQMGIVDPPKVQKVRTPISEIKKPVQQIDPKTGDVIATFPSLKSAARAIGSNDDTHISRACRGICKTAHGYIWRLVNKNNAC